MDTAVIELQPTTEADLPDLSALWNDPAVMRFVGFPEGLGRTHVDMEAWLDRLRADPARRHYTVRAPDLGFCGEAYYAIDREHDIATLDIKLRPAAQGRGIGGAALARVLDEVLDGGLASRAYVDPRTWNEPALRLYRRLGFEERERPAWLEPPAADATYLEISAEAWAPRRR